MDRRWSAARGLWYGSVSIDVTDEVGRVNGFDIFMAAVIGLSFARWLVTLLAALADQRRRRRGVEAALESWPKVTVLVPAFNEQAGIEGTIRSLSASDYPHLDIIVVDDGSTDATAGRVRALQPEVAALRLIQQLENGGKARALTAGAQATGAEIIVTVDADTQVEPDAVRHLVASMQRTGAAAAAGNVKVGNRVNWLTRWQALEYVVGLQLERRAQARLNCITTVPGALGAFRREALKQVGWFSPATLAEDTDLTLAMQAAGQKVVFEPTARAWTEAPLTAGALLRQRTRWLHGNLHCAFRHWRAFGARNPGLSLYGLPSFWYGHLITPLLLPVTALYLGRLAEWFSLSQILMGIGLLLSIDIATALVGLTMDGESRRLLPYVPIQRLVYPFFLWAAFLAVCLRALLGGDRRWNRVPRVGGWLLPVARRPAENRISLK